MSELIDTTEMYLRTIFELEEEGVVPLRARIAERLHQSGPTVSQTVSRMERDGLLSVQDDRQLQLSQEGHRLAVAVMRKHRLAELLLVDVIGLDWEDVHIEACRWEHVMSEAVERRLVRLLNYPQVCPHGNPIPGMAELGAPDTARPPEDLVLLSAASSSTGRAVVVRRISEQLQPDADIMRLLKDSGVRPGLTLTATTVGTGVRIGEHELPRAVAEHVFVTVG